MFRRGLKEGKIAREEGEIQVLHRSRRFTRRNRASVPNGCITGGRDSKEEIARRNGDKPVVSASKRYLHLLRIVRCDIPSLFQYNTIVIRSIYTPVYL